MQTGNAQTTGGTRVKRTRGADVVALPVGLGDTGPVRRLALALDRTRFTAVGLLVELLGWLQANAPEGWIRGPKAAQLVEDVLAVGDSRPAGETVRALVEGGFLVNQGEDILVGPELVKAGWAGPVPNAAPESTSPAPPEAPKPA